MRAARLNLFNNKMQVKENHWISGIFYRIFWRTHKENSCSAHRRIYTMIFRTMCPNLKIFSSVLHQVGGEKVTWGLVFADPFPAVDASKTSVVLQKSSSAPPKDAPATLMIDGEASDSENSASRENGSPLGQGSDTSRGWYPTLQKTLWILSKLYQCVQVLFSLIPQIIKINSCIQK